MQYEIEALQNQIIGAVMADDGEHAFAYARQRGIKDDAWPLWEKIVEYHKTYQVLPQRALVEDAIHPLPSAGEQLPIRVLIDKLGKVRSLEAAKDSMNALAEVMQAFEERHEESPNGIAEDMQTSLFDAAKKIADLQPNEDIMDLRASFGVVQREYAKAKAGEKGIPTPWPSVNRVTKGWLPGDFALLVARLGTGKTWSLLYMAYTAWIEGFKVLFVGTEMSHASLAQRFSAMHYRTPYGAFRNGTLSVEQEERVFNGMEQIPTEDTDRFVFIGDSFDCSFTKIVGTIEIIRPDIVFVDGLYLIRNTGKDRHTQVSNTSDDLKRLAKRKGIPIVVSHQLNRADRGKDAQKEIDMSRLAISDVAGWNADMVFALDQGEENQRENKMTILPLKVREGRVRKFTTHWDFREMNFAEIGETTTEKEEFKGEGTYLAPEGSDEIGY